MSAEYVILSFFKSNNISYYYNKPFIHFPCPYCCEEAQMNASEGTWKCMECQKDGTLITLMKIIEDNQKEQRILQTFEIYNPTEEHQSIRNQFKKLIEKHGIEMERLYHKVNDLIEYYKS